MATPTSLFNTNNAKRTLKKDRDQNEALFNAIDSQMQARASGYPQILDAALMISFLEARHLPPYYCAKANLALEEATFKGKALESWTDEDFKLQREYLRAAEAALLECTRVYFRGSAAIKEFKVLWEDLKSRFQAAVKREEHTKLFTRPTMEKTARVYDPPYREACRARPGADVQVRLRRIHRHMKKLSSPDAETPPEYKTKAYLQLSVMEPEGQSPKQFLRRAGWYIVKAREAYDEARKWYVYDHRDSQRLDDMGSWFEVARREWKIRYQEVFGEVPRGDGEGYEIWKEIRLT